MLKLNHQSFEWALKQALNYGDTDIFPEAFEFLAINHQQDSILKWLQSEDVLKWKVRPARHCLTPKHRYGFRISTQLDPIDFLVYTALVYELGEDLEARRVPKSEKIVHSHRFEPRDDGRMFDKSFGYDTFIQQCREIAGKTHNSFEWVVLADIADFFPKLYHHRLKGALNKCTSKNNHVLAIDHLISSWNENYSYGIPVGQAASRLLAEVAIDDVDKSLLSEGTQFVRFSDDFRIFCKDKREAYEKLAFLANVLFENHGLTLQQHKTQIMPLDDFIVRFLSTEKEAEINKLSETFKNILDSFYEEIEWDDLSEEQQEEISALNLHGILEEQSELDEIDIPLTRFVLRRLAQLGSKESLDLVLDNIDKLYPVALDVIRYIQGLRDVDKEQRHEIGLRLLKLIGNSITSHLEFHRMWLLSTFTHDSEYDNEELFPAIFSDCPDQFTQREIILALGRSKKDEWFRTRKRKVFDFSHWMRRALLLAGSCLPSDERNHWYQSLEPRLDQLELAVTKWARQNPF